MSYINEKNNYAQINADIWSDVNECLTDKSTGISHEAFVKEEHFMFYPDFMHEDVLISRFSLPFNSVRDLSEEQKKQRLDDKMPFTFSHTLTEQIGGLLKAGFELMDLYEDCDGGGLFDKYMHSYVAVRAIKK